MRKSNLKSNLTSHATKLVDQSGAAINEIADDVKHHATTVAEEVNVAGGKVYGQARKQLQDAATMVAGSIEDRPLLAMLAFGVLSAAAGFALAARRY